MLIAIALRICNSINIHTGDRFTKSGDLCVDFVFVTQVSKCMKVKQLEADNRFYIGYWNFGNKRSTNQLFGESAQH